MTVEPLLKTTPDTIFDSPDDAIQDFAFNENVAAVFDEMVASLVPY